jgi:predicted MFS family arabinose efflux permease
VTAAFGADCRRAITLVTVVGGFASTVFIPLAQITVDLFGWRGALIALGIFEAMIVVPLHWFGIPPHARATPPPAAGARTLQGHAMNRWARIRGEIGDLRFVGLVVWFTAHAAAFTGLTFQLVPVLQALRVSNGTILAAVAIIGPMQVLGRLFLAWVGCRYSTLQVGRWAMGSLVVATLLLICVPPTMAGLAGFAVLYGAGNGIMTILRGTAVVELFTRDRYAILNGALSAPAICAKAGAPLVFAWLWTATGDPKAVFAGVLVLVVLGMGGIALATRAAPRQERGVAEAGLPQPQRTFAS